MSTTGIEQQGRVGAGGPWTATDAGGGGRIPGVPQGRGFFGSKRPALRRASERPRYAVRFAFSSVPCFR